MNGQCGVRFFNKFVFAVVLALLLIACQSKFRKQWQDEQDISVTLVSEKEVGSYLSRDQLLHKLKNDRFDILVIGGGATGSGASLEAASRGLKTALIEAFDYSFGTSSRSTKLVHGGVRYLENAVKHLDKKEYELVHEALHERKYFLQNAPHLTRSLPILTPVYRWSEATYYLMGLKLYDLVSGDASLGTSKFLSRENTIARFPMIKKEGLKGAVMYYDGQFDDARMNITLILSALREGATAVNYVTAESFLKENQKIVGVMVRDVESNQTWPVYAKVVINATGVFADSIRKMDDPFVSNTMVPSQGSHVILPDTFASPDNGLIIPKTKDGRVIFLLPWLGKTVAGTTDLPEQITRSPKASSKEVEYILEYVSHYLDKPIKRSDVIATWSGLRPLAKPSTDIAETSDISRDHIIDISPSNLITIVGGKWTTYRKMGEDVVNIAISVGKLSPFNESLTKNLKLVGARFFKDNLPSELVAYEKIPRDIALHLAHSYGDRVDAVIDMDNKSLRQRLVKEFPHIEAEVLYAVVHEYALHATDVIARRTRLAFLSNEAARTALPKVVALMGRELNWDQERMQKEMALGTKFLDTMLTLP